MAATDEEVQALIARKPTRTLIRDLRNGRARVAMELNARNRRSLTRVVRWIRAELMLRFPAAKQAVQAARVGAITDIEKRKLDYDSILIDAIPASERDSEWPAGPRGVTDAQKEVLIILLGQWREQRMHGIPRRLPYYILEGRQINTARGMVDIGLLTAPNSRSTAVPDFWFTDKGLKIAKELYADMGLDANVIYRSQTVKPGDVMGKHGRFGDPDTRQAGLVTADALAFVNDTDRIFRVYFRPDNIHMIGRSGWECRVCDDGQFISDRMHHWKWHMRMAATVDAIDWANPVATEGETDVVT